MNFGYLVIFLTLLYIWHFVNLIYYIVCSRYLHVSNVAKFQSKKHGLNYLSDETNLMLSDAVEARYFEVPREMEKSSK